MLIAVVRGRRGLLGCRHPILRHRLSILSCRHSIQDRKYRSKGLLGAYFGIPKLTAFNSNCEYRSIGLFRAYFGIHTPPAGLAQAAFTEVLACLAATSVFTRRRQGKLMLNLPKYWLVSRLLRYSHTTGRTNSCCIYRSNQDFALYFRNLVTPDAPPAASFTEVQQVFLPTSVISSNPALLQPPHLRKYGKFFSPLP